MKINVNAVLDGEDVVQHFLELLAKNNIKVEDAKNVHVLVKSKDGKDVEVGADRLKVVFNQE